MIFDTLREHFHVFPEEYHVLAMILFVIPFAILFIALLAVRHPGLNAETFVFGIILKR